MSVRKMSLLSVFIALSAAGASIKIPAMIGSVALDVFPALLAAAFFGAGAGAMVGSFGHLLSAFIAGMPLGILHFIIAIEMALLVALFAILFQKGKKFLACVLFLLSNAVIAPIPFIFLFDIAFYIALLPSLFLGSLLNTIIAYAAIPRLSAFQGYYYKGVVKG